MSDDHPLDRARLSELRGVYRDGLLEDTLPFWIDHAVDPEHGGFLLALDRDGSVLDTDKAVWPHGRFTWLLSHLYTTLEPRPEWLELARRGKDFLLNHCFDTDGRMFFLVDREGRPLRKRRYVFTEAFGAVALAAWARAAGDDEAATRARELFRLVIRYGTTPGLVEPKVSPENRPMKGFAFPMIVIATAQVLRDTIGDELAREWIDRSIEDIRTNFMKPDLEAVMEVTGPGGEILDHFDGRLLNPGHAIECSWFLMAEARHRGHDPELLRTAKTILDWTWKRGWDQEHGGIIYYRDLRDLPSAEYWHDMKFWWPQNEAIIATLMAWAETGEPRYAAWHRQAHDWAHTHFPDTEHGEWFGYLHRDGTVSTRLKGNLWKGPFHLPRMQLLCWQLCEELLPRAE